MPAFEQIVGGVPTALIVVPVALRSKLLRCERQEIGSEHEVVYERVDKIQPRAGVGCRQLDAATALILATGTLECHEV